jgi:hypothetical protein
MRIKLLYIPYLLLHFLPVVALPVPAQIFFAEVTKIEFAPGKLPEGIQWSPSMELTEGGLATRPVGAANASWEVWVQTQPIPIGLSWRPPTSARIKLVLAGLAAEGGYLRAYYRYSSDRVHWSSWYSLTGLVGDAKHEATDYQGDISLPRAARERYDALMREWWTTDPAWPSDEHEFCVWLARHHPGYFATEFPFIGYVQVRVEGEARQMRVAEMRIEESAAVSGLQSVPKRKPRPTTGEKWFFDLSRFTGKGN